MSVFQIDRRAPGASWFRIVFGWLTPARTVGVGFRLLYGRRRRGHENIPREGALIFAANHQSHFDPPLVASVVRDRPCAFLARESLFAFRPFGMLIRFFGSIPLERGRPARALRAAMAELEAGRCVLMFPEGTRTRDGSLGPFKAGVILLVKKTGAKVVPVGIAGAREVWPSGRSWPRLKGRVRVQIGPPLPPEELLAGTDEEALELLRAAIVAAIGEAERQP